MGQLREGGLAWTGGLEKHATRPEYMHDGVRVCVYIYIYVCMCVYIHMYIYRKM
jgi:hypothetical protein